MASVEKSLGFHTKLNTESPYNPEILHVGKYSKNLKKRFKPRLAQPGSQQHCQKAEAIQVPINGSMNKENVVNTEMEYYLALRGR